MRLQWHKVTWYSKLLALALFVALPFIGFYFGWQMGEATELVRNTPVPQPQNNAGDYYKNISEWQEVPYTEYGFGIAYPIDFQVDSWTPQDSANSPIGWRLDANGTPGTTLLTITIPKTFEPQTNFSEAQLAVGKSKDQRAIAMCLAADPNNGLVATSTAVIGGVKFSVFKSFGAAAGNYYETASYRTVHAGECFAIEHTIHSTQIMNYPTSYNLHPFDAARVTDVLQRIVGTFKFF